MAPESEEDAGTVMATADGSEVVRALPGVLATVNQVRQGRCALDVLNQRTVCCRSYADHGSH